MDASFSPGGILTGLHWWSCWDQSQREGPGWRVLPLQSVSDRCHIGAGRDFSVGQTGMDLQGVAFLWLGAQPLPGVSYTIWMLAATVPLLSLRQGLAR